MEIKVVNQSNNPLPTYATTGAAGVDIRAFIPTDLVLNPTARMAVPTGLYFQIPEGFEGQIRPRSGLAIKFGITCLNSPGTIDSDYRGELKVILINHGGEPFTIANGDRIAQLVIQPCIQAAFVVASIISETDRGAGGFGHSGVK